MGPDAKRNGILKFLILLLITAASFGVALLCMSNGIYTVFQNIFIIPIILACFWFDKKGILFSFLLTSLFIILHLLLSQQDVVEEISRFLVFMAAALVIQRMAGRINKDRAEIEKLNQTIKGDIELLNKAEKLVGLGVWSMAPDKSGVRWSEGLYRLFGIEPGKITPSYNGRMVFTHPDDRPKLSAYIDRILNGELDAPIETRIVRPDGSIRWVRSVGSFEYGTDGQPVLAYGTMADITEQKKSEEALKNEHEKFVTTITSIGDGVIATDINGNVTIINKVAESLTGWSQKDCLGQPLETIFRIVNEYTRLKCDNPVSRVLQTGTIIGLANYTALIAKDGTERSIADSAAPIKDEAGKIHGVVLVFRDVTDEKKKSDRIRYISYHDGLTELYNRRYLEERIPEIDCPENFPISVIMGDVNGLKLTNDAFGHLEGDKLLKEVAKLITHVVGQSYRDCISARWGGDEFVMILPRTKIEQAEKLAADINQRGDQTQVDHMRVSTSFGCAVKTDPGEDMSDILKNAEGRMYQRKIVESQGMRGTLITTIMNAFDEKSRDEARHSKRVSTLSERIGRAMGLPEAEVSQLKVTGLLHDIGKIAISESILDKKDPLTNEEWAIIRRHPDIGYRILKSSYEIGNIAEYVLAHHERYDGKGYPVGLREAEIPLLARIVTVADSYDAMIDTRPYKRSMAAQEAMDEIKRNRGTQFDPLVVDAFLQIANQIDDGVLII